MLLTIAPTHRPATDLGDVLYKNPARPQSFGLSFGQAHVFYPEAEEQRCMAAMLLEVDPARLVRNRQGPPGRGLPWSECRRSSGSGSRYSKDR